MGFTERETPLNIQRERKKLQGEGFLKISVFQGVQVVGTMLGLAGLGEGLAGKDMRTLGVGLMFLIANIGWAARNGVSSYRETIELKKRLEERQKARNALTVLRVLKDPKRAA